MDPSHVEWVQDAFVNHYPGLLAFLRRHVTPERAEDLAQDAFLRLLKNPDFDQEGPSVAAWLRRVAANQLSKAQRKESRWVELEAVAESEFVATDPSLRVSVARDFQERVEQLLAQGALTKLQATVFRLRFLGDLSHEEINLVLDIKSSRSITHKALKAVRDRLGVMPLRARDD